MLVANDLRNVLYANSCNNDLTDTSGRHGVSDMASRRLDTSSGGLSTEHIGESNRHQVQQAHGNRHDELARDIGRREYGSEREGNQYEPAPELPHLFVIDDAGHR